MADTPVVTPGLGATKDEIESDARQMCRELGLDKDDHDDRERDEQGRFRGGANELDHSRSSGRR